MATCVFAQQSEKFISEDNTPQTSMSGKAQKALQKYKDNPLFEKVQTVRLGAMHKVQKDGKFMLSLPGQTGQFEVRMTSVRATSEIDYVWMGELADSLGSMTLVSEKGMIRGHFALGPDQYEISPMDGGAHALVKMNMKKLTGKSCEYAKKTIIPAPVPKNSGGRLEGCVTQPDQRVRVLVLFTASAMAADPNVVQTIQLAIAQTNQAYQNSQIGGALIESAGIEFIDFPNENTETPQNNLGPFIGITSGTNGRRARAQADLAVLITGNYTARVIGTSNPGDFQANNNAFADAIVSVGFATSTFTFAHELGHLFGARHQQCSNLDDTVYGGGCDNAPGYNHGYAYTGGGVTFIPFPPALIIEPVRPRATIMNAIANVPYSSSNPFIDASFYVPILQYSNPNLRWANAQTGTNDGNNNARWIGERFPVVARYNQSSFLSSRIEGPSSLNPYSTYTWEAVYRCGMAPYSFQWELSTNGFNYSTLGRGETLTSGAGFLFSGNPSTLRLTVTSADGLTSFSYITLNRSGARIGVDEGVTKPQLYDAFPNPTTGETTISYSLPKSARVRLDIIDQKGQLAALLVDEPEEAGNHSQPFNGKQLSAGIYLYRLQVDGEVMTKRLLFTK